MHCNNPDELVDRPVPTKGIRHHRASANGGSAASLF
jgi:hypothetical protein